MDKENKKRIEKQFLQIAKEHEDCETIYSELRSLLSNKEITEEDYDYISDNWDTILEKGGLL